MGKEQTQRLQTYIPAGMFQSGPVPGLDREYPFNCRVGKHENTIREELC
jgi:hypothetical protein